MNKINENNNNQNNSLVNGGNSRKKITRINSKVIQDFEYSLEIILHKNNEKHASLDASLKTNSPNLNRSDTIQTLRKKSSLKSINRIKSQDLREYDAKISSVLMRDAAKKISTNEGGDTIVNRSSLVVDFEDHPTTKVARTTSKASQASLSRVSSKTSDRSRKENQQRKSMVNLQKNSADEPSISTDTGLSPSLFSRGPFKWLSSLHGTNIPFQTTLIQNLPMNTHVHLKDLSKTMLFSVKEADTVRSLKLQIERKTSLSARSLLMFHANKQLENKDMLPSIEHRVKEILEVSKTKKWRLKVVFQEQYKTISVYSSDSIYEVKRLIGNTYELDVFNFTIKLNKLELEGNHDVFYYKINEQMEIIVEEKIEEVFDDDNTGYERIVKEFNEMTEELDKCNCDEKRRQAIADAMDKIPSAYAVLRLVTENYHLTTCAQANLRKHLDSAASFNTLSSTQTGHEDSVSSLHDIIHQQVQSKPFMHELNKEDFEKLIKCSNFKSFKRYLRSTIGTECNLKTVSSLYMCARGLLIHIGFDESTGDRRNEMTEYIKLYFKRYFVDKIREKGGMSAIVIQDYDVD